MALRNYITLFPLLLFKEKVIYFVGLRRKEKTERRKEKGWERESTELKSKPDPQATSKIEVASFKCNHVSKVWVTVMVISS